MKKSNVITGLGLILLIATIIVSVNLYFQGNLTPYGIFVAIGSALLSAVALIAGLKDSIELVKHISENRDVRKSQNSVFSIESPKHKETFPVGITIEAYGKHSLPHGSFAWALLRDVYGNYYLQNPRVEFETSNIWRATNIHLGREIIEIIFVKVTATGNEFFKKKVEDKDWDTFDSLPLGTTILERVRVSTK